MRIAPWMVLTCVVWTGLLFGNSGGAQTQSAEGDPSQVQGEPEVMEAEAATPEVTPDAAPAAASTDPAAVKPANEQAPPRTDGVAGDDAHQAPAGAASAAPSPVGAVAPSNNPGTAGKPDLISSGERVSVRDGDFSVTPPKGWEVYEHLGDLTLLMQMPHQDGVKYQRTIQVASFSNPRYIDETTAKEYEEVISRKFAATSAAIEGYRIRNHLVIDMADGRQGLLFYSEFTLDGVALMQAHILVSSAGRHYLMTYTDVAEHFESEAANQFLTEAWDSMISVQLGAPTPGRFTAIIYGAAAAVTTVLAALGIIWFRRHRAARQYRDYADGDSDGTLEGSLPATKMSSTAGSALSQFTTKPQHSAQSSLFSSLNSESSEMLSKPSKKAKAQSSEGASPLSMVARTTKKTSKKPETMYSERDEPLGLDLDDDEAV